MKYENEEEKNLRKYAKEAKIKIFLNNYLKEKLNYLQNITKLTKEVISECLSNENKDIISIFNTYQTKIKKDNNILIKEYEQKQNKYDSLLNVCLNDIPMGKPILLEEKNNNFCLKYIENENKNIIKGIDKAIRQSKDFHVYREEIRDSLVEDSKGDKEMEKYTTYLQNVMLYELKKCNFFNEKIKKFNYQKREIKKNMTLLNDYISKNQKEKKINNQIKEEPKIKQQKNKKINLKNTFFKSFRLPKHKKTIENIEKDSNENNSDDDKLAKKKKDNIFTINNFKKINDLFNTSIEDIDLEEEIYSDDEGVFDNKFIKKKQLSSNYLNNIKTSVPKLKFGLINYNLANTPEIDIYSLQRRKFINKSIQNQIKEMKKKKESAQTKLNNLKKKIDELEKLNKQKKDDYKTIKSMINPNNSISNIPTNLILNSINNDNNIEIGNKNDEKNEEIKDDFDKIKNDLDGFFDNIEEVEEQYVDCHNDEKSDDKDTKDTKKEDEEEKSNKKQNFISTRKFYNNYNVITNKNSIRFFQVQDSLKRTKSK